MSHTTIRTVRVEDLPNPVAGSIGTESCTYCGMRVWLSPDAFDRFMFDRAHTVLKCQVCIMRDAANARKALNLQKRMRHVS